ncbi:MAG: hypothetical protein WD059_00965 [Balneolaceae bacterium]
MQNISTHYKKAQTIDSLESLILRELNSNRMEVSNTLWGTSVCSDEVTNVFSQLNKYFLGPGPFQFGGISGLPFTGKTGFRAFASHIPDDGGAFILYGPHIGISKNGKAGEILREGQTANSTCCGSLVAGLDAVKKGSVPQDVVSDDYQQNRVVKMLIEKHQEIHKSDLPIKAITEIAYKQIDRELKDIISACSDAVKGKKILLMGGIVINTDWNQEDYFDVKDVTLFS